MNRGKPKKPLDLQDKRQNLGRFKNFDMSSKTIREGP